MAYSAEFGVAVAVFVVAMTTLESDGRELRPSDHGLVYSSPASEPAEAKSFFAGAGVGGTSPAGSGGVALPKAMNSNDTSWLEGVNAGGGGRRDHVRDVLVVVSLLCGITGVVLFVASAFVYLLRYRKRKSSASPSS